MKKMFIMALAACLMTACEKEIMSESTAKDDATTVSDGSPVGKTKKFTFTLKGDFSTEWKTRGYLSADGKDLTDVWVLDYQGGVLVQQVHQDDNTADDFGQPTMNLAYGSHHVYFIASRGQSPTLDTENHLIKFGKILDNFYKDYSVDVVSTSNGNRAVTLDRVVTRLRLTFTDAISSDAATINFTPHIWHYGWDYINAVPADTKTDQTVTVNIPASEVGNTGLQANLYGFSTTTEWTTDVAISSKTTGGDIIGSATITNVPFKANRISELSGPLFGASGSLTLSLNTSWDAAYNGTW